MLRTLVQKEILGHVLSLRFAVAFVLTVVLVGLSFHLTTSEYRTGREERGDRVARYSAELDWALTRWPKSEMWWEVPSHAFKLDGKFQAVQDPPLSAMVRGLTPAYPAGLRVTRDGWTNIERDAWWNPLLGLYQPPDFAYVVGVVMSLLAMLLVFDAVCGEKEAGTLRLMLASGAARHTVLLSKWSGASIVSMLPFLVVTLAGVGYMWAIGVLDLTGAQSLRVGVLILVSLFYIGVFISFGLLVSAAVHRRVTALFIALFVWVVWVLVLPNLTPTVAKLIAPAPSVRKITAEKQAVDREVDLLWRRLSLISAGEQFNQQEQRLEQERGSRKANWDRFLEQSLDTQNRWTEGLARISPFGSWIYAATDVTETGSRDYQRFEDARRRTIAAMGDAEDAYWKQRDQVYADGVGQMPILRDQTLPTMNITRPDVAQSLDTAMQDILILAIWSAVCFMGAFLLFVRYDVR